MKIKFLTNEKGYEVVKVFKESFYDYPVMKYILGENPEYNERLNKLIEFFVAARIYRGEPIIGIYNKEFLAGAAVVSLPGNIQTPEKLKEHRITLWKELGTEEQNRYEKYGKAAADLMPEEPHHHLNMIGVLPLYQGKNFARKLISEVYNLVEADSHSSGLSLSTETESNVKLYLHLGFEMIGETKVENNLTTWAFFKKN